MALVEEFHLLPVVDKVRRGRAEKTQSLDEAVPTECSDAFRLCTPRHQAHPRTGYDGLCEIFGQVQADQ